MNVWKVSWSGRCEPDAVAATIDELGGYFEDGGWYVPANFKYPSYICQRLAARFYGGGEYRITLTASRSTPPPSVAPRP